MKGLSDSRKVSATVIDFIKQNPGQSASVMRTLDNLFGVSPSSPTELALEVDKYYADSDNRESPLAKALAEARAQLKAKSQE